MPIASIQNLMTILVMSAVCSNVTAQPAAGRDSSGGVVRTGKQAVEQESRNEPETSNKGKKRAPETSGAASGKLTILEFGDLQCPDTANFATGMRQQIIQEFVGGGKGSYRFMDFPLDSHPRAGHLAEAARCAGPKADQMRALILSNSQATGDADLTRAAQSLGVDPQQFEQCLASGTHKGVVASDRDAGRKYGVRATPTLVVGFSQPGGAFKPVKNIRADQPAATVRAEIQSVAGDN